MQLLHTGCTQEAQREGSQVPKLTSVLDGQHCICTGWGPGSAGQARRHAPGTLIFSLVPINTEGPCRYMQARACLQQPSSARMGHTPTRTCPLHFGGRLDMRSGMKVLS